MRVMFYLLTCYCFVIPCTWSHALAEKLQISHDSPINKQNIEIRATQLEYQKPIASLKESLALDAIVGLGKINTNAGNTNIYTAGLGFRWQALSQFEVRLDFGLRRLAKHRFQVKHDQTKDYGGPQQFTYGTSILYAVNRNTQIGLRFYHMSNAGIYMHNPSLNTQGIVFTIQIP